VNRRLQLLAALVAAGLVLGVQQTLAAAPANDELANATEITSLPFADSVDTTDATVTSGEGGCAVSGHSVWYRYTPATDTVVSLQVTASGFMPSVTLWSGLTPPNGTPVCGGPGGDLVARLDAGKTYYIQLATRFFFEGGGPLQFTMSAIPAPANDDFADATTIGSIPFEDVGQLTAATVEPGEPQPSPYYPPAASVWYEFTPAASGSIMANGAGIAVAAYTGNALGNLELLGSKELAYGVPLVLEVQQGVPIRFQVLTQFGGLGGVWPFRFTVVQTPPPDASFTAYPPNPSTFDQVTFLNGSGDPAGLGIASSHWSFGDGTTSDSTDVYHQFAKDGDYDVALTVTTVDGRKNTEIQTVQVRTYDIGLLWFSVPGRARVGRAAPIEVGVGNTHYPETVQVDFYRSTPYGNQYIGSETKLVPKLGPRKTVAFSVSYTFTAEDLAAGKVTFTAVANPVGAGESFPADNILTSPPSLVVR
jgi:PKD repeat protein